jgi:hypothetical protein
LSELAAGLGDFEGGGENGGDVEGVIAGDVGAELDDRHEERQQDGDHAVGDGGDVDVGADEAVELLGAQPLGARLAKLGQRGDLEDAGGDVGLEAAEHALGQRVVLDRADHREEEGVAPAQVEAVDHLGQALGDHGGGVLVGGGEEQCLLIGEVGVGDGAADAGVAGDVGHRGGSEPIAPEADDGGVEDRLARLLAFRPRAHVARSPSGCASGSLMCQR